MQGRVGRATLMKIHGPADQPGPPIERERPMNGHEVGTASMNVVAYVIHLQRSASRMEAVRDLQDRCPVPTIVQDAVDGALLDDTFISHCYSRSLFAPKYPFTLRSVSGPKSTRGS